MDKVKIKETVETINRLTNELIQMVDEQETSKHEKLIEIGNCKPGDVVGIGGHTLEVLHIKYPAVKFIGGLRVGKVGVLCIDKDVIFNKEFDRINCNNWMVSDLRTYLHNRYVTELDIDIAKNLVPFERDLTSDDGLKDYCDETCIDTVSILSCDEYRRYRPYISNKNHSWWTLTPYSTPSSGYSRSVQCVNIDGSLDYNHADWEDCGVSAAYVLLPTTEVKMIEEGELC